MGWELYGDYEDVKWAEFNAGNTTFAINDLSALDPEAKAQTGGGSVAFAVENLDEFPEQLQAKGVKVTVPMNESPVCHFAGITDPYHPTATPSGSTTARTEPSATDGSVLALTTRALDCETGLLQ